MSAFICNETHISTCADILMTAGPPEVRDMQRADIAAALALENLKSVAWRYGPEGREVYDAIMAPLIEEAVSQGFTAVKGGPGEEDPLSDLMPGGQTGREYVEACRSARPVAFNAADGHAYLSCLAYQSCEHPEWEASGPRKWIGAAQEMLTLEMRDYMLDGRQVRELCGHALHFWKQELCPPPHIAAAAAIIAHYGRGDRSAGEIAETLAVGNARASLPKDDSGNWNEEDIRSHAQACVEGCAAGPPAIGLAEGHVLLSHLLEVCRDPNGPDPANPVDQWVESALGWIARDMRNELQGGRHVWEAPDMLDDPQAGGGAPSL